LIDTDAPPPILALRLAFNGLDGVTGETFARLDHSSGAFIKGFLGAGAVNRGSMNDEDFPANGAYSNTLQSASGHLAYGTVDLGYSLLRTPAARLGAFIGYNYYEEDINTYGCMQLADAANCGPGAFPASFPSIVQDGHTNSLRVGLNSQIMLTDRLKFTADVAYLPWVNFTGEDDHNARQLLMLESSSRGDGVMIEGILGYNVTAAWNIGVGGRYWAYNMKDGPLTFDFQGLPPTIFPESARYNSERYGLFVQSSYKWGDPPPVKAEAVAVAPMNWTGFYVGGHLGGGVGNDRWSDPFGPTAGDGGTTNIAGFGDTTDGNGPLGGVQLGANWQTGHWVLGVQGDISAADLRGENTCFSGLGGINCMRVVNAIGTVTGRLGFARDRSLLYAKAGAAWADTTYSLFGNTSVLALGTGDTRLTSGGWVAGAGIRPDRPLDHVCRLQPYRHRQHHGAVPDGGGDQRPEHRRQAISRSGQARRELQIRLERSRRRQIAMSRMFRLWMINGPSEQSLTAR
jgi:hypothetical protein